MSNIRAIIFDFDDTLVKTRESKWDALKSTGKTFYDLELTDNEIKEHWGKPYLEMLYGVMQKSDTPENIRKNYESITNDYPMQAAPYVLETINNLLKYYKIGVLTASGRKLTVSDLNKLNFPTNKFFYIQTAEDTDVHKPNPLVFLPILKKLDLLGIKKEHVLYIGDSIKDYHAANKADLQFIGILQGLTSEEEFRKENIPTINNLKELNKQVINSL